MAPWAPDHLPDGGRGDDEKMANVVEAHQTLLKTNVTAPGEPQPAPEMDEVREICVRMAL